MNASTVLRRLLLVLVLAGVAFAGWKYMHVEKVDRFTQADALLQQRLKDYVALRLADDWGPLYEMADPTHRKDVNLVTFLAFYGQGYVHFTDIRVNGTRIDEAKRTAVVDLTSEGDLQLDRLPPQFRNLREEHPEHLHQSKDHQLAWVWANDNWYFQMDPEVVNGKTANGEVVRIPQAKPTSLKPLAPAPGS